MQYLSIFMQCQNKLWATAHTPRLRKTSGWEIHLGVWMGMINGDVSGIIISSAAATHRDASVTVTRQLKVIPHLSGRRYVA